MKKILLAVSLVSLLAACSHETKTKMGLVKSAPDEFMVVSRAPLSLPPEYDLRPVNEDMQKGKSSEKFAGVTAGEQAFLNRIGAERTPNDIKQTVDKELQDLK